MFDVAVVVIAFNRPSVTKRLVEALEMVKPTKLFVVSDGPRMGKDDGEKIAEVREVLANVSWPCEVSTNYSPVNLGCKNRVSSGLDWVFTIVDKAIILEDDCIPDSSFFYFCEELLDRYADNQNVFSISGTRLAPVTKVPHASYSYSKYPSCWGWATWSRAWTKYDRDMQIYVSLRDSGFLASKLGGWRQQMYWRWILDKVLNGEIDSWAYRWMFTHWACEGYSIIPERNLVTNVGFGPDATHTRGRSESFTRSSNRIDFPLVNPADLKIDQYLDQWLEDTIYSKSISGRAKWMLLRLKDVVQQAIR